MKVKRIIFVCSGNICRSPMAAALAQRVLDDMKIPAMIISAGTLGILGNSAAAHAVTAMKEVGLDIGNHRSQGVSALMMKSADYVVVMAPEHEAELVRKDPSLVNKIHRIWEFAEPRGRLAMIDDPVNKKLEAFQACRDELEGCLKRWAIWLK